MSIKSRLDKLETQAASLLGDCVICQSRMFAVEDASIEKWLVAFFAVCPKCQRRRTWLDLVEASARPLDHSGG